jgi:hypothetical protein
MGDREAATFERLANELAELGLIVDYENSGTAGHGNAGTSETACHPTTGCYSSFSADVD